MSLDGIIVCVVAAIPVLIFIIYWIWLEKCSACGKRIFDNHMLMLMDDMGIDPICRTCYISTLKKDSI